MRSLFAALAGLVGPVRGPMSGRSSPGLKARSSIPKVNNKGAKWHPWSGAVVHVTEAARKLRYHGAESRQVLRAELRRRAYAAITKQYGGESRKLRRDMARVNATYNYTTLMASNEEVSSG